MESDTRDIELASKAGYDPNAMAVILERLSTAVEKAISMTILTRLTVLRKSPKPPQH